MEPWIFELANKIVALPGHAKWEKTRDEIARLIEDEMFEHFGRQVVEAPAIRLPE